MPVMRQKFLGVMAPLADKDIYTITGGKIGFAEEADPAQVYTMENPDKSPVKIYEPTREGFMAAQMDGAAPVPSAFRPAAPARRALRGNVEAGIADRQRYQFRQGAGGSS